MRVRATFRNYIAGEKERNVTHDAFYVLAIRVKFVDEIFTRRHQGRLNSELFRKGDDKTAPTFTGTESDLLQFSSWMHKTLRYV